MRKIKKRTIKIIVFLCVVVLAALIVQSFRMELFNAYLKIKRHNEIKSDIIFLDDVKPERFEKITLLYSRDEKSYESYKNISRVLDMTKLQYSDHDMEGTDIEDLVSGIAEDSLLVIASGRMNEMDGIGALRGFVEKGGSIAVAIKNEKTEIDDVFGIKENKGELEDYISSINFVSDFFDGLDDMDLDEGSFLVTSCMDVKLNEDGVKLIAVSKGGYPLIWTNEYGKGRAVYMNNDYAVEKSNRGLVFQSISLCRESFLWTVFNGKIVDIDDFPAPIKIGYDDVIKAEYSLTNRSFYRNIWWSFMHNLSKKYNIKYTGLIIGAYNLEVQSPLPKLNDVEMEDIRYFGRKLNEDLGEVGIHGYNHNSLVLEGQMNFKEYGYSPWESEKTMREGLLILKKAMEEIYGELNVYTYVPPSNVISKEGKLAVKAVFPELRVFAGLYTGEDEEGVLYQEFGKDPDIEGTWNLPRLSYGYFHSDETMWSIYNGIAHYGIVNHFIHPDDLLDQERSQGKRWKELSREIEEIFSDLHSKYPLLRPLTNFEAYNNLKSLDELEVYLEYGEDEIVIHHSGGIAPVYHMIRLSDSKIRSVEGGEFNLLDRKTKLYMIEVREPRVKIKLK